MTDYTPRGVRNNNPCNIRIVSGQIWVGQSTTQTDPDFVQFSTPEYGIRAALIILRNDYAKGICTIEGMVQRWAPNNENDTRAYIAAVASYCGCAAESIYPFHVEGNAIRLCEALIQHENGIQPYSSLTLQAAAKLAGIQ